MLTPKEAKKLLLDNFTDEDGNLNISNIDLSDFEGDVYLSGWKVKRNLFQGFQDVGRDLSQYSQKVGRNLYQDNDKSDASKSTLYKPNLQKELYRANRIIDALLLLVREKRDEE